MHATKIFMYKETLLVNKDIINPASLIRLHGHEFQRKEPSVQICYALIVVVVCNDRSLYFVNSREFIDFQEPLFFLE